MILSQNKFAQHCGCSAPAVHNAYNNGRINKLENGNIDTEDPLNIMFADQVAQRKKSNFGMRSDLKPKTKQKKEVKERKKPISKYDNMDASELNAEKTRSEILYKQEQIKTTKLKRAKELEVLIYRDDMLQIIQQLGARIKTNLIELPKRITPQLIAMAKAGSTDHEIEKYLSEEIADGIGRAKIEI